MSRKLPGMKVPVLTLPVALTAPVFTSPTATIWGRVFDSKGMNVGDAMKGSAPFESISISTEFDAGILITYPFLSLSSLEPYLLGIRSLTCCPTT